MKQLLIICLLLTGCSAGVPVKMSFPQAPDALMKPADPLVPLARDKKKLSDLLTNTNENYGKYHELEEKYQAWQTWYTTQKQIFEDVK